MNGSNREKIIVAVAAILFFAAFGAIAILDSSHGTNGEGIGENEVKVDVTQNEGHLSIPMVPSDMLILGASQDAKVDFKVENNDRDNDIDTIKVTIPGGEVINGSSIWYQPMFIHEWIFNATATDEATFHAKDDMFGRVFGGSAQYDVIGNQDDALDHFSINETILEEVSEAVTVTVEFKAPDTPGIKMGNEAIAVEVGDLMTENSGEGLTPVYPDGYTYMVVDNDYSFIVITVDSDQVGLEVQYGDRTLFASTRGTGYMYEEEGVSYVTDDGQTVAVLEAPSSDDVVVKPIIVTKGGDVGEIEISLQEITVDDITATGSNLFSIKKDNSTSLTVPSESGVTLVDTDGDWTFDIDDTDDDNDGIPDLRDPQPLIPGTEWININPTIQSIMGPEENKVKKGEVFTLSVSAEDADSDPLTFVWTLAGSDWNATGSSVPGPTDLTPGDHIFTVTVMDDKGGQTSDTLTIKVLEEKTQKDNTLVYILVAVVFIAIIAVVVYFLVKGKGEEEKEEIPEEIPPQEPEGEVYTEEPVPEYEEETMEEEAYEEPMIPSEPSMEEGETMAPPSVGTIPQMEEETGEIASLPGEAELHDIQDLENLIEEMERTEEEIGDVCPECGAPLGSSDTECSNCGAQFELALECPNCGAVVEENVTVCPNCGVSFA